MVVCCTRERERVVHVVVKGVGGGLFAMVAIPSGSREELPTKATGSRGSLVCLVVGCAAGDRHSIQHSSSWTAVSL